MTFVFEAQEEKLRWYAQYINVSFERKGKPTFYCVCVPNRIFLEYFRILYFSSVFAPQGIRENLTYKKWKQKQKRQLQQQLHSIGNLIMIKNYLSCHEKAFVNFQFTVKNKIYFDFTQYI